MSAKDNNTNTNIYRSYIDALLYPEQNPFIEDMKRFEELMICLLYTSPSPRDS